MSRLAGGAHYHYSFFTPRQTNGGSAVSPTQGSATCKVSHQLKEVLCARGVAAEWADNLPWVLLRLYAALKDESCVSTEVAALGHARGPPFMYRNLQADLYIRKHVYVKIHQFYT